MWNKVLEVELRVYEYVVVKNLDDASLCIKDFR